MQDEVSLKDLYLLIKKHIFTFLVATVIGVILSVISMTIFVMPLYESDAQILVNQRNPDQENIIRYSEIQTNVHLINTYRDIIQSQELLSKVSETTGGVYRAGQLQKAISVTQSDDSQMFTVRLVLPNPQSAQTILSEITREFERILVEIYQTDIGNIYVLQQASLKQTPVSPSKMKYAILGAAAGMFIAIVYVFGREVMDNTVKDDKFLQQLGVTSLGEVFEISSKDVKNARQAMKRQRGKA